MTTANTHPTKLTGITPEAHQKADEQTFSELLQRAITEPGIVSAAYSRFHRFSLSNQMLAALQLQERGMPLAPIASYSHWQTLGRKVRRGERAMALFMPVNVKEKKMDEETGEDVETGKLFTRFLLKRNWFSLTQTEGEDYAEPLVMPAWDASNALEKLGITEEPFAIVNGNVQGYASKRGIAVNPLAQFAHKTRFHELAHVVLGHTLEKGCWDTSSLPRHLQEAEAEGVAFILCSLLDLPGLEESRGYIQSWLDGDQLPEKSARRIYSTAQTILEAGKA